MAEAINRERLIQFLSNVDQEVLNMCAGEGTHRPGVLHFEAGKNSCPVMNRLEILKNTPTQKNLDEFLALAAQDFGGPTADFFKGQSQAIFVRTVEGGPKFVKDFDLAIKDGFYDMFKAARISMEPKQVELIETHALRLARVIETKIATAVGFQVGLTVREQLGALVEKQKEQAAAEEASQTAMDARVLERQNRAQEETPAVAALHEAEEAELRFAEARERKAQDLAGARDADEINLTDPSLTHEDKISDQTWTDAAEAREAKAQELEEARERTEVVEDPRSHVED